jgi:hypothetical protein
MPTRLIIRVDRGDLSYLAEPPNLVHQGIKVVNAFLILRGYSSLTKNRFRGAFPVEIVVAQLNSRTACH